MSGNSSNNNVIQNSGSGAIVVSQTVPRGIMPWRMVDDIRMFVFNGNGS